MKLFDKLFLVVLVDFCMVGYFMSHTSFIRSSLDVWHLLYGLVLVDGFLLWFMNNEDILNSD